VYLMRVGRLRRWSFERDAGSPEDVAEASRDLMLDVGEEGLSVYRIEGESEAHEVAVRFALTCRPDPQHLDYIVFPSELAAEIGLTVPYLPREDQDPFLNARHHEIHGLTADLSLRLAKAILTCAERRVERVRENQLAALGTELCRRDPGLKSYLKGRWATILGDPMPRDDR
jgi:hypothetical protein